MSSSANFRSVKNSLNYFEKENLINNIQKVSSCKRESSKKDKSDINLTNIIYQNIQTNFSNSFINTNLSIIKENKNDLSFNSYPVKPIIEDNLENNFIKKKIKVYKPPSVVNNKLISFQKQINKQILEFPLFEEKQVFKDTINRSYLQDEFSDDGSESDDEKINEGKIFLTQELEDSFQQLSQSIKKDKSNNILSRKIRFKK